MPRRTRDRLVGGLYAAKLYPAARSVADHVGHLTPGARRLRSRMLGLYRGFVRPGDLCFDVGANVGNRTEMFLVLGARVVAVEPQAFCLQKLRRRFGSDPRVKIVPLAVGREPGEAELRVSSAHTISSMSSDWVERVRATDRFGAHTWHETVTVAVTTLDVLIGEHGVPAFCKIDVEGYEEQVLAGLSRLPRGLSFEFTPEAIESAAACVRRLAELGPTAFNYSIGDTGALVLDEWLEESAMTELLPRLGDSTTFGDVYARAIAA